MRRAYRQPTLRTHRYRAHLCKVVTLHDHRVLAPALLQALSGRAEVLGDTPYGAVAVELAEFLLPDVVVAGELLADGLIDHFLAELVRVGCRVLLVAEDVTTDRLADLVGRGLAGVCTTGMGLSQVAEAVLDVAAGGVVLPPPLAATVVTRWRSGNQRLGPDARRCLSLRELEVLNAMADGLSIKATAHLLGVATKTVENHRTRIFSKLGVRNQAQLMGERAGGQLDRYEVEPGSEPDHLHVQLPVLVPQVPEAAGGGAR